MEHLRRLAAALVLTACAACGPAATSAPAAVESSTPAPSPVEPSTPPAEGELVTSQQVLPAEAAYGFADIATSQVDAARAWQRFGLAGAPPEVEDGTVLLFRGLGESGSCPTSFAGLAVDADEVRFADPAPPPSADPDGDGYRVCTSDYRPRTLVVAAPADVLPQGPFDFEGFVLSTTPLATPPPAPSVVDPWIPGELELEVSTEPSEATAGQRVDLRLTTGRYIAWPGSWETLLDRWEGQRWLPATGAPRRGTHPAATPATRGVPAGTTGALASVETTGLPPGDYRVSARVGLGDAEGSAGVQGFFRVSG